MYKKIHRVIEKEKGGFLLKVGIHIKTPQTAYSPHGTIRKRRRTSK